MEYEDIVQRDIEIHWLVLEFCERNPWIRDNMNMIVSKYPWQDICVIVSIAFVWGLLEIGPHFFWVCAINLGISFGTWFPVLLYFQLSVPFLFIMIVSPLCTVHNDCLSPLYCS